MQVVWTWLHRLVIQNRQVFVVLLSLDVIIVLIHMVFGAHNHFFHLDYEQNLPTTFQSLKLILFGIMFFVLGLRWQMQRNMKSFLLPLAVFTTALGFDELLQIHENIYRIFELFDLFHPSKIVEASMKLGYKSSLWILYYLPFIIIFVFWSGYWLRHFQAKMKDNAWILILSSLSLFAVLLTEVLSSTGSFSENAYFWLVTVEEAAEMLFATTLVLVGLKVLRKYSHSLTNE